ncbi:unnamed protein product [Anisakis simplex]|uniref:Acyltransferase 3 domain-containing protein n=1 Tax=Anisakis simplex TaxID=6269 RepID=A0A3P6U8S6_ANISI|nr:unnamed protein product [Anisakis simplex]
MLAFSMYTNGKAVLRTEKGGNQIHCLHGMRVMSMFWIILGHTYYYIVASLTVDNLLPTLIAFPQKFLNLIIVQAPLAVDSFFYLRLTPTYVVVMILDVTLFTYISDGPFWRPIESNYCRKSWWTNLIYMNNFLLQDTETCMGWTWYLANDMQFHLFAPIFLILLFKSSVLGILACLGVIAASTITHLAVVLAHDYPPAPLLTAHLQMLVAFLQPYSWLLGKTVKLFPAFGN